MSRSITQRLTDVGYRLVSVWIWISIVLLIAMWLPLLVLVRFTDRDKVRYRTGRWFRRLGRTMAAVNPLCNITVHGVTVENPRLPFLVVSNHQSFGDIPAICHLPWEMKWIGKKELMKLPVVGWLMRLAGDISLDRKSARSGAKAMVKMKWYLDRHCSVIVFPEGTRSKDGRLLPFKTGAFGLAIKAGVPVLPVVVNGSSACLPKNAWIFSGRHEITVTVLPPIHTRGMSREDVGRLTTRVRDAMARCLKEQSGIHETQDGDAPG